MENEKNRSTQPIKHPEEVNKNPDPKIDADHPGFPHGQASEEKIKPETEREKKNAQTDVTDGEKKN